VSEILNFVHSFDGLPSASRLRLRAFLDAADTASPYQDPQFFGGRGPGEIDVLVERNGRPVFFALGFENPVLSRFLPGLKSLVVHKGPVADDPDALLSGLQALKELCQKKQLCEIQISPQIAEDRSSSVTQMCDTLGFRPLASASPSMSLRLDITCDADQLLARFRKGTRYEVKRAERIGIAVRRAETETDFLSFYRIYRGRASYKGFAPLPIVDFYELSKRIRAAPERGAIFLSEYSGEILAGAIVLRAGRRVHYVYGATDAKSAGNLPGAYPVLSRAIEWAREIGCTEFDFGGYGPAGVSSVRRFKEGFGGEVRNFGPAYSLTLMSLIPRLRRAVGLFRS